MRKTRLESQWHPVVWFKDSDVRDLATGGQENTQPYRMWPYELFSDKDIERSAPRSPPTLR